MFYRQENSAFRILLYIEDVLPSYLKQIFSVKKFVEEKELFKDLPGTKNSYYDMKFTFNLLTSFFPIDESSKYFLEIVNDIFTKKKVSYNLLISKVAKKIQKKYINDDSIFTINIKAIMILMFLHELNLLKDRKEGKVLMNKINNDYENKINQFFENHANFFDSDIKRGVFLEGVLAKKLLNIQYQERKSKPFRARLNGLKIDEKLVKRLLPEIQNKLEEYDKNYYKKLEKLISKYLLLGEFDDLSNNEMSFYFTTGMNLADEFKFENQEN